MILAKVAGSIVTSARADKIEGARYLLAKSCNTKGIEDKNGMVVLDLLGVGMGELVLVSQGSSACQTRITEGHPVDAIVIGIVDTVEEQNKVVFRK